MQQDLRLWLRQTAEKGELVTLRGVHWRVEIGAVADLVGKQADSPALLFDDIPDYPKGYRVLVNALGTPGRVAHAGGLPAELPTLEVVAEWKRRYGSLQLVPHHTGSAGPILDCRQEGNQVDLYRFPSPQWRAGDGGRYIGTGTLCVTRDPETGAANVGTARVMVHDARHVFYRVSSGKDSRRHFEAWQRAGRAMPIAICCGQHPSLLIVGGLNIPYGTCEYDVWGGLAGEPLETVQTPLHGLPVPAHAELVLEGEVLCDQLAAEGPFGEWSGYYSREARQEPLIRVQAVHHREQPIILGVGTARPPSELMTFWSIFRSALLWDQLEKAGVGPIRGVWCHPAAGTRLFIVVALEQRHPGHARQSLMAAAALPAGAYMGRYLVAVDADIDPTNIDDVLWAMSTRSDPARDVDLIRGAWGGPLDPAVGAEGGGLNSRMLIDACRPFGAAASHFRVAGYSDEERARARTLWAAAHKERAK
ncbi:MAG: UbiD family decarboxylase [Betaproteobacteria bacterium]|jgi:4-hydroxy-3-polyprenylbenzoate decarboxylase|nr:UbiD family decarboxylase [Betaproteobacteria bacterium]